MIETRNLVKTFKSGDVFTPVLKGIDFKAVQGEFISIMGRSGAGKSTLLYQMSLLDDPTEGEVVIDGHNTHTMSSNEKMRFRLRRFGFVFQDYALMPELSALENVALPLLMQGKQKVEAYAVSIAELERAGLGQRIGSLPSQLSGGEQQRVSIVRAVAHKPKVLFADEPTANLDNQSSARIMEIFIELHKAGQTIIMVTHEEQYAKLADRTVHLDDGRIVSETRNR
jgi:putative ABC transport system ATP-binding protein